MRFFLRFIAPFIFLILIVLLFTQPKETHFLERIANDYGQLHGGMKMSSDMLKEMGKCEYKSFFVYSTFHYQFGTIGVAYLGLGGQVYYLGSTGHSGNKSSDVEISV